MQESNRVGIERGNRGGALTRTMRWSLLGVSMLLVLAGPWVRVGSRGGSALLLG